mmetsp:Transcript_30818/g.91547  ORF Transcript_30818/g.91547 Transcript_30818/m.91547 type:complete len:375 (-) Transcript_30818:1208-2332(-)
MRTSTNSAGGPCHLLRSGHFDQIQWQCLKVAEDAEDPGLFGVVDCGVEPRPVVGRGGRLHQALLSTAVAARQDSGKEDRPRGTPAAEAHGIGSILREVGPAAQLRAMPAHVRPVETVLGNVARGLPRRPMPQELFRPQGPPNAIVRHRGGSGYLHAEHGLHLHHRHRGLQPRLDSFDVRLARKLLRPWRCVGAGGEHAAAQQHGQQDLRVHVRPTTSHGMAQVGRGHGDRHGDVQRGRNHAREHPRQLAGVHPARLDLGSGPPVRPAQPLHDSAGAALQFPLHRAQLGSASQGAPREGVQAKASTVDIMPPLRTRLSPSTRQAPTLQLWPVLPACSDAAPVALDERGGTVGLHAELLEVSQQSVPLHMPTVPAL